jgi:hypothetical protein
MGSFGFHCADCDLPMLSEGPDKHDYCFKCEEQFSTNESGGGCQSSNHLLSPNGQVYSEGRYEGYGVYGEKDAYALLAQTNIEAVREWRNDPEWEPTGDNDDDRSIGIDIAMSTRKKTHAELVAMVQKGITITEKNMYHYSKDLLKNPIKIVCDNCFTGERHSWSSPTDTYDKCDSYSRDHKDQSWTSATDTDVGWVCHDCGGY